VQVADTEGKATGSPPGIKVFAELAVIVAAGLAAHGLILLSDYILWDGWGYSHWLGERAELVHLERLFREIGRPLDILFWIPFIGVKEMQLHAKYAGVATWILSACLMYLVLLRSRFTSPSAALMCGVLATILPVFDVLGELAIWMNTACVALFWAGWWVLVSMPSRGALAWLCRAIGLGLFFLSFNLNSQLVYFYAFAVCLVAVNLFQDGAKPVWAAASRTVLRYADFAVLPIVFWTWKRMFTPNSGYYEGYNNPAFTFELLSRTGVSLFSGFLADEARALFESPLWFVVSLIIVVLCVLLAVRRGVRFAVAGSPRQGVFLFLVGGLLLFAGAFSYAVVDQSFSASGWLTRNCILLALPLSMLLVGALILVGSRFFPHRPGLVWSMVALIALMGIGSSNRGILRWQAFGAKQESIGIKLRSAFMDKAPSFVQLRDYFLIPNTIYYYPPIVWTYLLARGLRTPKTFVIETAQIAPDELFVDALGTPQRRVTVLNVNAQAVEQAIEQTSMPYAMVEIPRHGLQALAIVEPTEMGNDGVALGWEYLKTRWLQPGLIPQFLGRLTSVQVQDLPSIPAD